MRKINSKFTFKSVLEDNSSSGTETQFDFFSEHSTLYGTQINLFDVVQDVKIQPEIKTEKKDSKILSLFSNENEAEREEADVKNFSISDFSLGSGTISEKIKRNVEAIKLLKLIENDNRAATLSEQDILSKYIGWGGLTACFTKDSQCDKLLRELLSEAEYRDAKASVLSAYYTQPAIIQAVYKFIENCGFTTGNILEPAMGVGNFFGMLPKSMANSNLYGVEIDSISGRIAKLLYPKANIQITGYEKTKFRDNFFDLAIGNVPFGNYMVADRRYDNLNLLIHDYFFCKTIDLVRPNGLIAFITSKGTLDKEKAEFREYIAKKCDFLGAVRLPNSAFRDNAGTTVVSDIIFLRKREYANTAIPYWCASVPYLNKTKINQYFLKNANQVIGNIEVYTNQYGNNDTTVLLPDNKDYFKSELSKAIGRIEITDLSPVYRDDDNVVNANADTDNYAFTVYNGEIYYRKNSIMEKVAAKGETNKRYKALIEVRDILNELLEKQLEEDLSDDALKKLQETLNYKYDNFVKVYGRIKSRPNVKIFADDASMPLLKSLEITDSNGDFIRKADIFTKRTIRPFEKITKCDNAIDALSVSLGQTGVVSFDLMEKLTGSSKEELKSQLKGQIFPNPGIIDEKGEYVYEIANKYLSGNIRKKLAVAKEAAAHNEIFADNVLALERSIPAPLTATEINCTLGQTWIPLDILNKFMRSLFRIPSYFNTEIEYCSLTHEYSIKNKYHLYYIQEKELGTTRRDGYKILTDTLNNKIVKIYDTVEDSEGKKKQVLNEKETHLAQNKQEIIKNKFSDWVFDNQERREELVKLYNEKFNSVKVCEYDGSHLTFTGMNPEFKLYDYQKNAIAHSLYGNNVLFATCVGSGKTAMMIGSIMEGKRLGKLSKALVVVPKHLTEQTGEEFLRIYPNANIMVVGPKDFTKDKRKEFVAKIATSNYDAIIMSHSQLAKIPLTCERQMQYIQEEIDVFYNELENSVDENGNKSYSTRSIQQSIKSLEAKMEKLSNKLEEKSDKGVFFEKLGVDKLVVDEAHYFKNLAFPTKMTNVAGVNTTNSEKAQDLFLKTRYLNEITDNNGLIFATGTPVSNSMTEIFTMQRYLQMDVLKEQNLEYFDSWAAIFGEVVQQFELAPEGTGFRLRERMSRFHNLPELMQMFKQVAEIKTQEELNIDLPELVSETITVESTEYQKRYVEELGKRAEEVHDGIDPSIDNMLKVTMDGRKCGLDMRIIDSKIPDDSMTKVNSCVDNVFRIYMDTQKDSLTQIVFCDLSVPNPNEPFTIYDDVRSKLISMGVKSNEIAFIHEYNSDAKKKELFAKVRLGDIRILLGSTGKLGVGSNVQDKLIAIHDLDIPWRPSDLEQRLGRMYRQGNTNKKVYLFRYTTKATFDAYLYQILESKQRFISQVMTSKNPVRSADNIDDATLSFAEVKALCTGDSRIKEKLELDAEVAKLNALKDSFRQTKYQLETDVNNTLPAKIKTARRRIEAVKNDIAYLTENYCNLLYAKHNNIGENKDKEVVLNNITKETELSKNSGSEAFEIVINDKLYKKRPEAAEALNWAVNNLSAANIDDYDKNYIGEYAGMRISVMITQNTTYSGVMIRQMRCRLKGNASYFFDFSESMLGSVTRIENTVSRIPSLLKKAEDELEDLEKMYRDAVNSLKKYSTFSREKELIEKEARLKEFNIALCSKETA